MWDKYLPPSRAIKAQPKRERDPEEEKRLLEEIKQLSESPDLQTHDERNIHWNGVRTGACIPCY
jgi:hypothetical protein